ncbi:uroporphyrinogen-III synthase [Thalassococcus sp. S3]|uniref:uroporphyrinogen-III synthase n=1 Tax=Thalassococcus sp. S3 TaxID=2017482 RepID=UPI0013EEDA2B|nr:uroporphyrinogen-III synthase [Thalassococcus sp. S3]
MTSPKPLLLLTRPRRSSAAFADRLGEGLLSRVNLVMSPLLEIVQIGKPTGLEDAAGVIFTSSNAVRIAGVPPRPMPAYCVGRATADLAADMGWVSSAKGRNAEELVARLVEVNLAGPLIHLRGRHARGNVASRLSAAGCFTTEQILYDAETRPLSDVALSAIAAAPVVIAPVFSPRSATLLSRLVPQHPQFWVAAMSDAVAQPLDLRAQRIDVAPTPTASEMRQVVENMVNQACRVESGPGAD